MTGGRAAENGVRPPVIEVQRVTAEVEVLREQHALDVILGLLGLIAGLRRRHFLDGEAAIPLHREGPHGRGELSRAAANWGDENSLVADHGACALLRQGDVDPLLLTWLRGGER